MKKKLILIAAVSSLIGSCAKVADKTNNNSTNNSLSSLISGFVLPEDANDEVHRIFSDIQSPDYEVAIIDNPNFGKYSQTPEYDIIMGGASDNNISISLNGTEYVSQTDGQWTKQDISLKNYYNKNVDIVFKQEGNKAQKSTIYVPKPAVFEQLSPIGSQSITRSGNQLKWESDINSTTQKVVLYYQTYSNDEPGNETGVISKGIELLNDNGSYNIDHLVSNSNVKKIYLKLISGNAFAFTTSNNKKLLFYISTHDHHEYMLE